MNWEKDELFGYAMRITCEIDREHETGKGMPCQDVSLTITPLLKEFTAFTIFRTCF